MVEGVISVPSRPVAGGAFARLGSPAAWLRPMRRLVVPVALLVLWQWAVERGIYSRGQLPAPLDVWDAFRELTAADLLGPHVLASVRRVLTGFALGGVVALALGLVVGVSRGSEEVVSPTLGALRAVPSLAWVPLLLLWMGIYEAPKITLVAIGAFFPIYTNLVAGIRQIDRKLVEVGRAYGLRGPSLAWAVMIPASLPSLLTGMRLGLAQGWLFLVAAELIAANKGLGYLLIDSSYSSRVDITVLAIVLLALLGKTSDTLLQLLERWLLRWTDTFRGGA